MFRGSCVGVVLLLSVLVAEGINLVVLVHGEGGYGAGFFPLSSALTSAYRLALEHVDDAAAAATPGENVTISTAAVGEGIGAVADLCVALDREEDTVAVRRGCECTIYDSSRFRVKKTRLPPGNAHVEQTIHGK